MWYKHVPICLDNTYINKTGDVHINVILKHERENLVVVKKQEVLHILSICL